MNVSRTEKKIEKKVKNCETKFEGFQDGFQHGFDKLLTPEDVAELLGTSRLFVIRQSRSGKLPAIKLGKVWRFRPSALRSWLAEQECA
jgi:excisionase family DNA binding protein